MACLRNTEFMLPSVDVVDSRSRMCAQKSASLTWRPRVLLAYVYLLDTYSSRSLSLSLSPLSSPLPLPPLSFSFFRLCLSSFHFISFRFGSQRSAVGNLLSAAAPPKAKRKFALNQIRWNFLSVVCTYRGRPGLAACFRLVLLSMMNLRWPRKLRNSESAGVTKTDVREREGERERERRYERWRGARNEGQGGAVKPERERKRKGEGRSHFCSISFAVMARSSSFFSLSFSLSSFFSATLSESHR